MANFDDIFNSQPKEETEGQSFASFDKDEWAAQKKQERENAFALIDETAQHMTNDGELFQSYLDVLKALIHNAPCPIEISQQMPEGINAAYRPQDKKIFVRAGLDAGDIFRGLSQELAHAHLDNGEYKRNEHAFTAYCASYMLCSRYNVAKDMFRFERLPENISTMDARSMRNELSKIRDVANEISADMAKILEKDMKPKERRDEAR